MKRKTNLLRSIFVILLLCNSTAWSDGFYVGLGGGPEAIDFKQSATISRPGSYLVNDDSRLSGTGLFGSIFGGYAWIHRSFYLAGEGNFEINNANHQRSNDEFIHQTFSSVSYRLPHAFGLNLLPGYLFTPTTLFYARIGYALGHLKVSSSDISIPSFNKNLNGFSFGLGVNQVLSQHVAMRMEYHQINYQDANVTSYDPVGGVAKATTISPTAGQVEFALIYNI